MPNFEKQEIELSTRLDQWLYFIKHLEDFQNIPTIFKDEVFTQAFEKAELAKLAPDEMDRYESSLKTFRDNKAVFDYAMETAQEEGRVLGKAEGKQEIAKTMKVRGFSVFDISELTGLSAEEIKKL